MLLISYIPPRFRFFLKSDAGDYYSVAPNGDVVLGSAQKSVEEPIGWKETEIKWARSLTYWGLVTTLTTAYKFVEDGAKILRHIYFTQGVEGKCRLVIEKRRKSDFTYEAFYEGDVDFSTFLDEDSQVTVNVEQGGMNARFRANENTPYEVTPITEAVRMDGVKLRNKSIVQFSGNRTGTTFLPDITNIFNESNLAPSTFDRVNAVIGAPAIYKGAPFFVARTDGDVIIEYDVNATPATSSGSSVGAVHSYTILIFKYNPTTQTGQAYQLLYVNWPNFFTPLTAIGTVTIPMDAGEQLSLISAIVQGNTFLSGPDGEGNTAFDIVHNISFSTLKINYYTRIPESTVGASRYHEVVSSMVGWVLGGTALTNMPFLTDPSVVSVYNRPYHTRLTSAQDVRGVSAPLKLKFSELFKDMHGRWLLGLGIVGNTVTIAPIEEFFQDVPIADLGEVTNLQIEPAGDLLFSDIKLGMKTVSADQLNGRLEVTSNQTWKAPLLRTNKTRDASSPFISGMFSIEQIRGQIGKETTNTEPDNDIVVLETDENQVSGRYPLYRPNPPLMASTVLQAPIVATAYNLTLRPRLDLLRNKPLLSAVCHNVDPTKKVNFQTAEREGNLYMFNGSVFVDDRESIPVSDLGSRPFLPVRFRFLATVPDNLYQLLTTTPYGYFTLNHQGRQYKGFVEELSQKTADDAAVTCSLLAHPATDLTTLIR